MLVPEVAAGAAEELAALRAACDDAVRRLAAAEPHGVLVVGSGRATRPPFPLGSARLSPWGPDLDVPQQAVPGQSPRSPQDLPLSITIGAWLTGRNPLGVEVAAMTVAADTDAAACAALGRDTCATWRERVALLVMGDGSATRSQAAPGYFDARAAEFDRATAAALADADTAAFAGFDDSLANALGVAGLPAWRVLAGAAADQSWRADLLYDDAPYGVGYFVASWAAT